MEEVVTVQLEDIRPYRFVLHRIRSAEHWSFPRHRHNRVFEFYYLFEGRLVQVFDGELIEMAEGDLLAVGEEEFHSLRGKGFGFYNLILPVEDWALFLKQPEWGRAYGELCGGGRFFHNLPPALRGGAGEMLEELFFYQKKPFGDLLLQKFLSALITDLSRPRDGSEHPCLPPWMEALLQEAAGRLDRGLTVRGLAELSGRSPEHVSRSFRRHLGETPSSWLNGQKLRRACLLLEHSNTPVLDIALSLGYGNLAYFYKLFSERWGMPPGEYRRRRSRGLFDPG